MYYLIFYFIMAQERAVALCAFWDFKNINVGKTD